jgi:hypothetical protein
METVNLWQKGSKRTAIPFVGKLYYCPINHVSGFRLNKKANYLANQVKICNCATRV